jgi:uncharacterized membrane protein
MRIPRIISEILKQFQDIRHNLLTMYKFLIFIVPFLTISYYFIFVFDYLPPNLTGKYGGLVIAYFLPPAGKESIIPLMLTGNTLGPSIPVWVVASTIVIMDVICAFIIAYNWWFVEFIFHHIPFLNRGYVWLQKKSGNYRRRRWITISLIIFMIIPFQGTGGINTPILARLLGIKAKKTVFICFTGSFITTILWIFWWFGIFNNIIT